MSDNQNNSIKVTFKGNVENSNIINAGGDVEATLNSTGNKDKAIEDIFQQIYIQINNRNEDPDVDKAEVVEVVKNIETECKKEGQINTGKLTRWLKFLGEMAPDILDVTIKTLSNPLSGIADVVKKISEKAK